MTSSIHVCIKKQTFSLYSLGHCEVVKYMVECNSGLTKSINGSIISYCTGTNYHKLNDLI